jgi:hypothetical protein
MSVKRSDGLDEGGVMALCGVIVVGGVVVGGVVVGAASFFLHFFLAGVHSK